MTLERFIAVEAGFPLFVWRSVDCVAPNRHG